MLAERARKGLLTVGVFAALLWAIHLVNVLTGADWLAGWGLTRGRCRASTASCSRRCCTLGWDTS
ncbi:hypothetical protein [Arthrobacter sp. Bz4]|uniref:hypothetical protein n=1 Tax=Arthrobacter sp. Bz4 TaxID=2171979 RepID=UPI00325FD9C6